jgi:hypothetical protein
LKVRCRSGFPTNGAISVSATAQLRGPAGDCTDGISNIGDGDFADQAKISEAFAKTAIESAVTFDRTPIEEVAVKSAEVGARKKVGVRKKPARGASPGRFSVCECVMLTKEEPMEGETAEQTQQVAGSTELVESRG